MKWVVRLIMLIMLLGLGWAQTYQSRSDSAVIPLPQFLPKWPAAGAVITDSAYGNRILRLTDSRTVGAGFLNASLTSGLGGSGDVPRVWNADATILSINTQTGRCLPIAFDPVNFTTKGALYGTPAFMPGCGIFSATNPNLFFYLSGSVLRRLDYSNRTARPSLPGQPIYNFIQCAALGAGTVWKSMAGMDMTDNVFTMGISAGTQDSGYTVVSYDISKKICYSLNTKTGVLKSFQNGAFKVIGSVQIPDRFLIHNVKVKDSVAYITRANTTCFTVCDGTIYAYPVGQPKLYSFSLKNSGHWETGCTHWINQNGNLYAYFWSRLFSAQDQLDNVWPMPQGTCNGANQPACASTFDQHGSWTGTCSDLSPVIMSTVTQNDQITGPWEKEVVGFSTDGTNKQWRFAHTYASTVSKTDNFSAAYAIGQPDLKGRFFAWGTKAGGQFGCTTGTRTCAQKYLRSDVMVVELR